MEAVTRKNCCRWRGPCGSDAGGPREPVVPGEYEVVGHDDAERGLQDQLRRRQRSQVLLAYLAIEKHKPRRVMGSMSRDPGLFIQQRTRGRVHGVHNR